LKDVFLSIGQWFLTEGCLALSEENFGYCKWGVLPIPISIGSGMMQNIKTYAVYINNKELSDPKCK
jgi:hypothetical protein